MPPTNYREKVQACGFMEPAKALPLLQGPGLVSWFLTLPVHGPGLGEHYPGFKRMTSLISCPW